MNAPFVGWPCVDTNGKINPCLLLREEIVELDKTEYQRTSYALKRLKTRT